MQSPHAPTSLNSTGNPKRHRLAVLIAAVVGYDLATHKAAVSIGGGKVAQFECEAEPPKQRVARQPEQRLPANWKKIRGKVLAKVRSK